MTDRTDRCPDSGLVRLALALSGARRSDLLLERAAAALAGDDEASGWAVLLHIGDGRFHAAPYGRVTAAALRDAIVRAAGPDARIAVDGELAPNGPAEATVVTRQAPGGENPAVIVACWPARPGSCPGEPALRTAARLIADAAETARTMEALLEQSCRDPLTGALNRRGLLEGFEREAARARRSGAELGVVFLDLDRFKRVNDRFGHAAGDRVLTAVADAIRDALRATDAVARLGGDEFVALLHDADLATAAAVARRLADRIASLHLAELGGRTIRCSTGVASSEESLDPARLLHIADRRMYDRKGVVARTIRVAGGFAALEGPR